MSASLKYMQSPPTKTRSKGPDGKGSRTSWFRSSTFDRDASLVLAAASIAALCSIATDARRSARRSARSRPPPHSRGRVRALPVESHRASHVSSRTPSGSDSGRHSLASLVRAPCNSRWLARSHRIGRSSAGPPRSRFDLCHSPWVLDSDAQLVMARGIVNLSLSLAIWANDEPQSLAEVLGPKTEKLS